MSVSSAARQTRRAVVATGAAALAPILVACGAAASTAPDAAPRRAPDPAQRDELTWLIIYGDYSPRKDAYDAMQRRFNEQFPNVTLQRIDMGSAPLEKLTTMMAGGDELTQLAEELGRGPRS